MILTIDIGNTSAKVAVFEDNEIIFSERVATDWHTEIGKLRASYAFTACAVSNVAGPNEALDHALELLPCPALRLTYTSPCAQPYFESIPQGLGADRLAADIAAVTQMPNSALLVIDAGTCLTFDVIDETHRFAGGNISPGVELRLKAMHDHTAALPLISVEGELPDLGYDTETALRGGAINGVKFEIEGYIRMCRKRFPNLHVFYTGGNHFEFSTDVAPCITHDPHLVLRGLRELCR
jgi:type III pantothenate kinase